MLHIRTDPINFTWDEIEKFKQQNPRTEYLLETQHNGKQCAIFYGGIPNTYKCAYYTEDQYKWKNIPAVEEFEKNCDWIEDLDFVAVQADNGDVIFSRYPGEHRVSDDGTVWVCDDRVSNNNRKRRITLYKGRVEYWQ